MATLSEMKAFADSVLEGEEDPKDTIVNKDGTPKVPATGGISESDKLGGPGGAKAIFKKIVSAIGDAEQAVVADDYEYAVNALNHATNLIDGVIGKIKG